MINKVLVLLAFFGPLVCLLYEDWDRISGVVLGFLREYGGKIKRRLFHLSILIPLTMVVSWLFGFFGYEIRVFDKVVMAFVVSLAIIIEEEVREGFEVM